MKRVNKLNTNTTAVKTRKTTKSPNETKSHSKAKQPETVTKPPIVVTKWQGHTDEERTLWKLRGLKGVRKTRDWFDEKYTDKESEDFKRGNKCYLGVTATLASSIMKAKMSRSAMVEDVKESRKWVMDSFQWLNDLEARIKNEVKPEQIDID